MTSPVINHLRFARVGAIAPFSDTQTMQTRIKEIRSAKKLTQAQLAEIVGTTGGHISDIENDKREPSTTMLKAIATALNVDTAALLSGPQPEAAQRIGELAAQLPEDDQRRVLMFVQTLWQASRE